MQRFVIIGAQKSGTRWLRQNLGLHPEIFTTAHEVNFFNHRGHYEAGERWYTTEFLGWDGEEIVGEATPGYMMWRYRPELVAERMQRFAPEMRLFAVLRNPIDRAYSGYFHHLRTGKIPLEVDFMSYVREHEPLTDRLGLVAGGWYAASLEPFRQRFGDQLRILVQDDLDTDAAAVYEGALAHLGADTSFVPPDVGSVRFSNAQWAARRVAEEDQPTYEALTLDQRRELYRSFEHDIGELEVMIGRDLSAWCPDGASG